MSKMNRLSNLTNPFQGKYRKVLCVCSAGLLRSPTAALVLSQEPFNFNTRAAGMSSEYGLIVVDDYLISWADEIVVMESWMQTELLARNVTKPIKCLFIEDNYAYRDPALMAQIAHQYTELTI